MLAECYSLKEVNISNINNLINFDKIFGNFNKNIKINLKEIINLFNLRYL